MRRRIGLALVGAALATLVVGPVEAAPVPTTCPGAADQTNLSGNATAGIVQWGRVNAHQITIGASGGSVVAWSPGDVDWAVCTPGGSAICTSTQPAGVVEVCANLPNPNNPSVPGPPLGPGTYIVLAAHCMDAECGYPEAARFDLPYAFVWGP